MSEMQISTLNKSRINGVLCQWESWIALLDNVITFYKNNLFNKTSKSNWYTVTLLEIHDVFYILSCFMLNCINHGMVLPIFAIVTSWICNKFTKVVWFPDGLNKQNLL